MSQILNKLQLLALALWGSSLGGRIKSLNSRVTRSSARLIKKKWAMGERSICSQFLQRTKTAKV